MICLFFFSFCTARGAVCLDSSLRCRCRHCLNKYLHIYTHVFFYKHINQYSLEWNANCYSPMAIMGCSSAKRPAGFYDTSSSYISSKQQRTEYSLFILDHRSPLEIQTNHSGIRNKKKHTHAYCRMVCRMNLKVDALIDLQALITCNWPLNDLSDSAKLMTVLTAISYWFLSSQKCFHKAQLSRPTIPFWSHPTKLQGLDPYASMACLESIKVLMQNSASCCHRYEKRERGWGHPKRNCATLGVFHLYNFVQEQ